MHIHMQCMHTYILLFGGLFAKERCNAFHALGVDFSQLVGDLCCCCFCFLTADCLTLCVAAAATAAAVASATKRKFNVSILLFRLFPQRRVCLAFERLVVKYDCSVNASVCTQLVTPVRRQVFA